jgi:hypothetical protein
MNVEGRKPRSIRGMNPALGLHRLKRQFQKKFMAEQCQQLTAVLDDAIAATFKEAPVRRRAYLVDRSTMTRSPAGKEAQLEWAVYQQWSGPSCERVEGCWQRLINFQVNLPAKRGDKDWGEIDLLGVAEDGLPVLIELKHGSSTEPPPRLLVQVAAYGLALQKAWHFLRGEWRQKIAAYGFKSPLPTALLPCRLLCAAPQEYWDAWSSEEPMWTALEELREAFAVRGLPSAFATISSADSGAYAVRLLSV